MAVLSNNDGCVISRSAECKALGVGMGTPYFKLRGSAEKLGLVFRSSNYELYGDLSSRIVQTLGTFTPDVEQYSIDEAFLHLSLPADTDWAALGAAIRARVLRWVGIPCGVGFAPTRTLAKIANHIGKKKPGGVFVMPDDPAPLLSKLPVEEIWGVGRRLAERIRRAGVSDAWTLATRPPDFFRRHRFAVTVERTALELRGVPATDADPIDRENPQSINVSRMFGRPVTELPELEEALAAHASAAAEKLRRADSVAAGANVLRRRRRERLRPGVRAARNRRLERPKLVDAVPLGHRGLPGAHGGHAGHPRRHPPRRRAALREGAALPPGGRPALRHREGGGRGRPLRRRPVGNEGGEALRRARRRERAFRPRDRVPRGVRHVAPVEDEARPPFAVPDHALVRRPRREVLTARPRARRNGSGARPFPVRIA